MPKVFSVQDQVCRRSTANGALKTSPFATADQSKVVCQVFEASDLKIPINITLKGIESDGFYRMLGCATNYRRNYFRASCSITVSKPNTSDQVSEELVIVRNGKVNRIKAFLGIMKSLDAGETLRQYTAKRDRGPVSPLAMQFTTPANLVQSNCKILYQRVQFKSCGRNGNANHKFALSRSNLVFELFAQLENDKEILIRTYESSPFIIRGRSEKYFRSLEDSPDFCHQLEMATRALMQEKCKLAPLQLDFIGTAGYKSALELKNESEPISANFGSAYHPSSLSWVQPGTHLNDHQTCLPSPVGSSGCQTPTTCFNFNYSGTISQSKQYGLVPTEFGTSFRKFATCYEKPVKSAQDLLDSFFECEDILDSQHQDELKRKNDIGFNDPTPVQNLIKEVPLELPADYLPSSFSCQILGQHRSETVTSPVYFYSPPLSGSLTSNNLEAIHEPYYMAKPDTAVYDRLPWDVEDELSLNFSTGLKQ